MDPISAALIAALATGVAKGVTEVGTKLIPDAYHALKRALQEKFGVDSNVVEAVDSLEKKSDSKGRAETLQEEIKAAGADQDPELLRLAEALQQAVKESGTGTSYQATLSGTGALAQGEGASAVAATGEGSIAIGQVGRDVNLDAPGKKDKTADDK